MTRRRRRSGGGLVTVLVGWVGFTTGDRESFIPAGFAAVTRPGAGPGTPYSERTSEAYRQALALLDFNPGAGNPQALTLVPVSREGLAFSIAAGLATGAFRVPKFIV